MRHFLTKDPSVFILVIAGFLCAMVVCTAVFLQADVLTPAIIACTFLALGVASRRASDPIRDSGAAAALMGQAIAFTAAFQGHQWQVDTHMLYFALLACVIVLRSIPAILVATVVTAAHHLSLSVFMPALVFPGGDLIENLGRTTFHAVIVLMETAVLVFTVLLLKRFDMEAEKQNAKLMETVDVSEAARAEAEDARKSAEKTRQQAVAAQSRAEDLLREAEEAEKMRLDAESERKEALEKAAQSAHENAAEQAQVVNFIREAMMRLQDGDLTTRIDQHLPEAYRDVGLAFNEAIAVLDAAVGQVAVQCEDIQAEVQSITSAAEGLAGRTERQAEMLRDSSEGLAELTNVVSKTETTVKQADAAAHTAQSSARSSETVVTETAQAMHAIQAGAEEISHIVRVIDDIAFQTNLLALNAGVEAARAGEAGRGFAVVASEVRSLAQRSSESATSIRGLIERSDQQVKVGSSKIGETVDALTAVLAAVQEISAKTGTISKGAKEQSEGISELNGKVAKLDRTTQENAAMFEETAAACSSLQNSAGVLTELTRKFHVSKLTAEQSAVA